jgi:hypothetical protein
MQPGGLSPRLAKARWQAGLVISDLVSMPPLFQRPQKDGCGDLGLGVTLTRRARDDLARREIRELVLAVGGEGGARQ